MDLSGDGNAGGQRAGEHEHAKRLMPFPSRWHGKGIRSLGECRAGQRIAIAVVTEASNVARRRTAW